MRWVKEYLGKKELDKLDSERSIYKRKCKCSHSTVIRPKRGWELCSYCGRKIFLNEKEQFKYDLEEVRKKVEG